MVHPGGSIGRDLVVELVWLGTQKGSVFLGLWNDFGCNRRNVSSGLLLMVIINMDPSGSWIWICSGVFGISRWAHMLGFGLVYIEYIFS